MGSIRSNSYSPDKVRLVVKDRGGERAANAAEQVDTRHADWAVDHLEREAHDDL